MFEPNLCVVCVCVCGVRCARIECYRNWSTWGPSPPFTQVFYECDFSLCQDDPREDEAESTVAVWRDGEMSVIEGRREQGRYTHSRGARFVLKLNVNIKLHDGNAA